MILFVKSVINLFRILFLFSIFLILYPFCKNKSIYFFLKSSGPSFIKLGQLLSTRPDLVGEDLALILSSFQDKLPSFSFWKAREIVLEELQVPLDTIFAEFENNAVFSASIAQVHKAKLRSGEEVAVKILRPNIAKLMARDIVTLRLILKIIGFFSPYFKEKLLDILQLLENCAAKELDLMLEASAASDFKEKLKNVKGFYIPKIYWKYTTSKVLVLEWIHGIPFSDKERIRKAPFDKKQIAQNLVISYFNQVYEYGFFHADMHPGNLFLMKNGDIGVVDFGIIGIIDRKTKIAVAEILIAFLDRDYRKVAKLHIDAGLVPDNVTIDDFALTARIIGEAIVDKSVKQVSLATLLGRLILMTRRYNIKTRPELLLLQKTMMLIEGVGVAIDEDLNMWELARPWMREWASQNIGFDATIRDAVLNFYEIIKNFAREYEF